MNLVAIITFREAIQIAKKLNCNWIALSYVKNSKIIKETRKLISTDMGIIAKVENKSALKNIKDIIQTSDAIMVARGDLAVEIGANEVPHVQLDIVKKCSELGKPVIIATQMLESMILDNKPTRAEINDVGTDIFQGAVVVMLSAETAVGKYPLQAVQAMKKTIVSTEKYKKEIEGINWQQLKPLIEKLKMPLIVSIGFSRESVAMMAIFSFFNKFSLITKLLMF